MQLAKKYFMKLLALLTIFFVTFATMLYHFIVCVMCNLPYDYVPEKRMSSHLQDEDIIVHLDWQDNLNGVDVTYVIVCSIRYLTNYISWNQSILCIHNSAREILELTRGFYIESITKQVRPSKTGLILVIFLYTYQTKIDSGKHNRLILWLFRIWLSEIGQNNILTVALVLQWVVINVSPTKYTCQVLNGQRLYLVNVFCEHIHELVHTMAFF